MLYVTTGSMSTSLHNDFEVEDIRCQTSLHSNAAVCTCFDSLNDGTGTLVVRRIRTSITYQFSVR